MQHYSDQPEHFRRIAHPSSLRILRRKCTLFRLHDRHAQQTRQPTPGVRLAACSASLARRGCAQR